LQKNFLVPREIPLAARSHRFFGKILVKAGHLMRPSAQRKVPRGHEDEERLTADIIEPCLASTNKSLAQMNNPCWPCPKMHSVGN
jgi:hypothetical protein